jgi:hypothetical protein
MGARSRNKRRLANVEPGPVLVVRSSIEERCYSRKVKFDSLESVPQNGYDGTALRGYLCDLCGWWHCTSGGTIRWRSPERGNVQPGVQGKERHGG